MLETVEQVAERIREGNPLLFADDEQALRALPQGRWIAGITPYFIDMDGEPCWRDHVSVTELPDM